jgi:hypothetical protein
MGLLIYAKSFGCLGVNMSDIHPLKVKPFLPQAPATASWQQRPQTSQPTPDISNGANTVQYTLVISGPCHKEGKE